MFKYLKRKARYI